MFAPEMLHHQIISAQRRYIESVAIGESHGEFVQAGTGRSYIGSIHQRCHGSKHIRADCARGIQAAGCSCTRLSARDWVRPM